MFIGLVCYWGIGAPAAWLLAFKADWGPTGVWWGLALGLACAALTLIMAFEWKTLRLLRPQTI
jgi:MATE family multidrug resistance protein